MMTAMMMMSMATMMTMDPRALSTCINLCVNLNNGDDDDNHGDELGFDATYDKHDNGE